MRDMFDTFASCMQRRRPAELVEWVSGCGEMRLEQLAYAVVGTEQYFRGGRSRKEMSWRYFLPELVW